MAKTISLKNGLRTVLFWSIISAAFIGPGTVTTASKAGANFQVDILWALVFSILATIILQEAAARITIASDKNLGEIIAIKYGKERSQWIKWLLFFSILIGCAAYQAGNILGAIAGLDLFLPNISKSLFTVFLGLICAAFLWIGNFRIIANLLGVVVALMGIAFLAVAFNSDIGGTEIVGNAFIPQIPEGSLLLIIGLIGTTIVPYNLFLASGISKGQSIFEMRLGITLAVIIGGIISIAIMIAGTNVVGEFSFQSLADSMSAELGINAPLLLGFGLFAAGISSSITSPLAAAVTGKSLIGKEHEKWDTQGSSFRWTWGMVLLIGIFFGIFQSILGFKPVGIIILAQAVNGILLPLITAFLLLVVNDERLLGEFTNSAFSNILMLLIVGISCFLGINNVFKAIIRALEWSDVSDLFILKMVLTLVIVSFLAYLIFKKR